MKKTITASSTEYKVKGHSFTSIKQIEQATSKIVLNAKITATGDGKFIISFTVEKDGKRIVEDTSESHDIARFRKIIQSRPFARWLFSLCWGQYCESPLYSTINFGCADGVKVQVGVSYGRYPKYSGSGWVCFDLKDLEELFRKT